MSLRLQIVLAVIAIVALRYYLSKRRPSRTLPPGPPRLPIIGNLLNFPLVRPWETFVQWGHTWGDLMSFQLMGQTYVILNSEQATSDLLVKKGYAYDYPSSMTFSSLLCEFDRLLVFASYERGRHMRKVMHGTIGNRSLVAKLYPIQEKFAMRFLQRALRSPENLSEHLAWMTGGVVLEVTYGYQVKGHDDPLVKVVTHALLNFNDSTRLGRYYVDIFPFLRHIPGWVPGFGFQQTAVRFSQSMTDMAEIPYQYVKDQMMSGSAEPSLVSNLLEEEGMELPPERESIVKWAAASVYGGGTETTISALCSFFLAMIMYPEVQKKAQDEIDIVVGDRFLNQADLSNLPYLHAVVKEVYRWNPIIPLGSHSVGEDDEYRGYFIPKGSKILFNMWAMLHNPKVYKDPMTFNPDRFIAKPGQAAETDPKTITFGFGRRSCPGMHLVDSLAHIVCAMSLAMFDITKMVDENGVTIEPRLEYTDTVISRPVPFKCSIKPRSSKKEKLVLSFADEL